MANGALILPSYYEAIKDLPDADRLALYDCLVRYGLYGEEIELPPHLRGYFTLMRPSIDSSRKRYAAAKANGDKGGRPPKNRTENQRENQTSNQSSNQDKDLDSYTDSYTANDFIKAGKPPRVRGFTPPTVEQIAEYCREKGYDMSAEEFVDYYRSVGWIVGKSGKKMKDWKAAVNGWYRREQKNTKPTNGKIYDYSDTEGSL